MNLDAALVPDRYKHVTRGFSQSNLSNLATRIECIILLVKNVAKLQNWPIGSSLDFSMTPTISSRRIRNSNTCIKSFINVLLYVVSRLQSFMQIHVFTTTISEMKPKWTSVAHLNYHNQKFILNISYALAYYVFFEHFFETNLEMYMKIFTYIFSRYYYIFYLYILL